MAAAEGKSRKPWLPPRWFIRFAWAFHRGLFRISGGRFGLRTPRPDTYGMLRLTVTGRRSGVDRSVILGYLEDGPNLVTMAMNGWGDPEPAWWLNLQANPFATVELGDIPDQTKLRMVVDFNHALALFELGREPERARRLARRALEHANGLPNGRAAREQIEAWPADHPSPDRSK